MVLKAVLDSVDALSDELKKEYVAGTGAYAGKFVLDVAPEGTFELADTGGLKSALVKERETAANAVKAAKAFEGIDPKSARDALEKIKEMDGWDADKKLAEHKAKFEADTMKAADAKVAQLQEKHAADMEKVQGVNGNLLGHVNQMAVVNAARAALAEHEGSELLMPHIEKRTRATYDAEGNTLAVEVLDEKGDVMLSPASGSTAPASISELVGMMKNDDKYKTAFAGSGASGGGATGGGAKKGPNGTTVVTKNADGVVVGNLEELATGKTRVAE
jgi:hypothetical protein